MRDPSHAAAAASWEDHACGLVLRPYQRRAFEAFQRRPPDARKFFLLAPPGSGKTILGLMMAAELGAPALVLSPTTTIAGQWLSRLAESFVRVLGEGPPAVGVLDVGAPAPLYSLTYQRLSVAGEDGDPHPNVAQLHAALAGHGVRTVVLDECHHLRSTWGEAVEALLARLVDPFVIGLTATATSQVAGPYTRLVAGADHQVSLPSVVRSGDLAPFQELVMVTTPSRDESALLAGRAGELERAWTSLLAASPVEGRPSLAGFLEGFLVAPRLAGERTTLAAALDAEPELVTAVMRYLTAAERFHPPELPPLPEFDEPLTLGDRARLIAWYLATGLQAPLPPTLAALPEVLAAFGFALRAGAVVEVSGEVRETVGFSREKLAGLREIVRAELAALGTDLRLLVLTDYEFPPDGRRGLSCRDVVEALTSDPATDVIDPVMVTGRSLIVDDDLWPRFEAELGAIAARGGLDLRCSSLPAGGAVEVTGTGEDWSTRALVAVVTELLERGVTRCLVGTKSLLGEGWDCLRLNTLVDLTVVTSGVTVNQVRGRTLRLDPDDPAKVADNWDVLCYSAEAGDYELARLRERHDQLYGVAPDGGVERGLGHVHPWLLGGWEELGARREELNDRMCRRAAARDEARGWWGVGKAYADEDWPALELRMAPPRRRPPNRVEVDAAEPLEVSGLEVDARNHGRFARTRLLLAAGAAAGSIGAVLVAATYPAAALLAPALIAGAWASTRAAGQRLAATATTEATLSSLAGVVLAAEGGAGRAAVHRMGSDTLVVTWEGVDGDRAERLTRALAEVLGNGLGQRYLLRERSYLAMGGRWVAAPRCYPVPRAYGSKRRLATFVAAWRALRCPAAEAVHADTPEGRELLRLCAERSRGGRARVRWLWR